ncbi:hypothetical protein Tco_1580405, partial [Tanacetum coccineum]
LLLVAVNSNFKAYVNSVPSGFTIIKPAPEPSPINASSIYSFHFVFCPSSYYSWKSVSSSSFLVSAKKSTRI